MDNNKNKFHCSFEKIFEGILYQWDMGTFSWHIRLSIIGMQFIRLVD
jgi:hypothetical protein